ncbi:MAG: oligosaccharide flippase family protein [Devosiaceae bacterium]|nr:oligosaccharide flippase family protein [Devosiaceae bacterium MH13]
MSSFSRLLPGVIARVIQLLFGLFIIVFLANTLSPSDLGLFYILLAVAIAFHSVVLNALWFPLQRLLPAEADDRAAVLKTVLAPSVLGTVLFSALSYLVGIARFGDGGTGVVLAFAVISVAFSEALFAQSTNICSALRHHWLYCLSVLARSALIATVLYLARDNLSVQAALVFFVVGNFIASLPVLFTVRKALEVGAYSGTQLRCLVRYAAPFSLSQLIQQVADRADRIVIGIFLGTAAAGQYSVAVDFARRVIGSLSVSARLTYVRDAVDHHAARDAQAVQRSLDQIMGAVLVLALPASIVLSLFGAAILGAFLPASMSPTLTSLLAFLPFAYAADALMIYVFVLPFELAKQRWLHMQVITFKLIILVPLFIVLMASFGLLGAALAQAAALVLTALYAVHLVSKTTDMRLNIRLPVFSFAFAIAVTLLGYAYSDLWADVGTLGLLGIAGLVGLSAMLAQLLLVRQAVAAPVLAQKAEHHAR